MADMIAIALEAMKSKGFSDAQAVSELSVNEQADGTYLIEHENCIPTWRQRAYNTGDTPVGKPYKWQGQVYKLWQQHDAAGQPEWSPDKAVSLWDICHTTDPAKAKEYVAPAGTRGLWQAGECCVQNGKVWRCLEADNAYGPEELPERWEELGTQEDIEEQVV